MPTESEQPSATPPLAAPGERSSEGFAAWLAARPWATFVVPFVVYMLIGTLEPTPDKPFELGGFSIGYESYPLVYTVKVALTVLAMAAVWPGYRQFPFRLSPLAIAVGAVGVVLWVALTKLGFESWLLSTVGFESLGQRSAFNPLEQLADRPLMAYGFLAVRFLGLAIVVPVIEEFFLRGFAMRFVIDPDHWPQIPFGTLTPAAAAVGTLLPMAMHPAELLAAAVWFSMITWLMHRTRNIWDCVAAHAVTNGLLGAWVLASGEWSFL